MFITVMHYEKGKTLPWLAWSSVFPSVQWTVRMAFSVHVGVPVMSDIGGGYTLTRCG